MRQSTTDILRRWMALDRQLCGPGLRLTEFAAQWGVDPKTVRRDLAAFRRLGYAAAVKAHKPRPGDPRGANFIWRYGRNQRPMFTATRPTA